MQPRPALLPRPKTHELLGGSWSIPPHCGLRCQTQDEARVAELAHVENYLRAHSGALRTSFMDGDADAVGVQVVLEDDASIADEGYRLRVDDDGPCITARTGAGAFYGVQTLLQLPTLVPSPHIPHIDVTDEPRFPWRGMHLDVARHFFDVEFVKRFIDLMARHKLNTFHWHLTEDQGWRLEIPGLPRLTEVAAWRDREGERYGGYYTADDVREVLRYAEERFIKVVPEIEMPGHAVAALAAYPECSCTGGPFAVETTWGIFDDVYCAGRETTFKFLDQVLDYVCNLFPGKYVHIGGDECPKTRWKDCDDCQRRIQEEGLSGEDELQSWFVKRAAQRLQKRGRRIVGWDEILEGGLAPDATVMSWQGFEGGIQAASMGHDVVMTPTAHCYFDYKQRPHDDEPGAIGMTPLRKVYELEPIPTDLPADRHHHVLGTQGNVWTERMPTHERVDYMVFPRMCALSEVAWSSTARDWPDFRSRLDGHLPRLRELGVGYRVPTAEDV